MSVRVAYPSAVMTDRDLGMSMNAVAIVRIEPAMIHQALPALEDEELRRAPTGEAVRVRALGNATLVHLGMALTEDQQVLGIRLVSLLGEVLAAHDDARGVPIFPESYALEASSWDQAIAELGDGADWVPLPSAPPGLEGMMGALGGGGMDQLAGIAEQLSGGDGAALLEQAMQMAQQMAQSGALAELAQAMGGGAESPEEALRNMGVPPGQLGGIDLGAMAAQAQSMLAANPELEEQLRASFGAGESDEDGDGGGS